MPRSVVEQKYKQIHLLFKAGETKEAIAKSMGITVDAVKQVLKYTNYNDYFNRNNITSQNKPHRSNIEIMVRDMAKRFDRLSDQIDTLCLCVSKTDESVRSNGELLKKLCDIWKE